MPLNSRRVTDLIRLFTGSLGDFTGRKYSHAATRVSIAGGNGNTTRWRLDGGDNKNCMAKSNLPFPFPGAVSQFSVESTALGAQGGSHSGGLVNVVTCSGSNTFHGWASEFIRNNYINASNFYSASKDSLHQNQYSGAFGGSNYATNLSPSLDTSSIKRSSPVPHSRHMCPPRQICWAIFPPLTPELNY